MKRTFIFCLLTLVVMRAPVWAQRPTCLPLKVGNPAGNYIIPGAWGDIVYRRVAGRSLALDAYVQKRGARRPAVLVIHGGGGTTGSRAAFTGQFLEMLTAAGYNWFAVDYRLTNADDAVDDIRAALAFIRCHAQAFRIDPQRIALLGEDSGAELALRVANTPSSTISTVIAVGGRFDNTPTITSKAIRALLVHGTDDREVPLTAAQSLCIKLGEGCQVLPVEGGIHRAENWRPSQWSYKAQLLKWLGEQMNLRAANHEPYQTALKKVVIFSAQHNLKLDAYVPRGRGPHPAVIIAHGGGWEAGDRVTYVTPLFAPLARAGFAWFSINYRLTPQVRHPEQLEDLRAAIRFVSNNARRFNIDPTRLVLLGESASGQMVAQLATEKPAVAAVVSFYGVYDFEAFANNLAPNSIPTRLFGITQLNDETRATLRRYSPLHNVTRDMPPLLLLCGTKDGLYAQHQNFEQKLQQLSARHSSILIEGAPHGMENWEGHAAWMDYRDKLLEWLRATLSKR